MFIRLYQILHSVQYRLFWLEEILWSSIYSATRDRGSTNEPTIGRMAHLVLLWTLTCIWVHYSIDSNWRSDLFIISKNCSIWLPHLILSYVSTCVDSISFIG